MNREKINIEFKQTKDYLKSMYENGGANKEDCENVQMHLDNIYKLIDYKKPQQFNLLGKKRNLTQQLDDLLEKERNLTHMFDSDVRVGLALLDMIRNLRNK